MSKVIKTVLKIAAVVAVFFIPGVGATIGKALLTAAVAIGVSRLIAKRADIPGDAGGDAGGRIQLPPATTNKLPIIYGSAFVGGAITDAMLSTDQKTMWYVVALNEVSDTTVSAITFGDIYYGGKLVQFGTNGAVTALITNNSDPGTAQTDTRVNGYLDIYLYSNGSNNPYNSIYNADQVLSVANGVPASKAWDGTQTMTNCAFAIVKVKYSTDAGTTGISDLLVQVINTENGQASGVFRPGSAIKDYMINTRYGCGLPLSSIDTQSLIDLNTYSDDQIDYKPVGWNTGDPYSQQSRYTINGPLDTSRNCLDNLQFLVDTCDSWLQYSELTGLWRVVMNKGYTQLPNAQTLNDIFLVNSSNLVGGIDVAPIDLNETYNQIEVGYPNANIKDQTDYQIIDLFTEDPQLLSENEAINRLNVTLPLVNNAVQARYLAARRIYQSREDLAIAFKLDFSGIQVEAGDLIRVTHEVYGWTDKLFRVSFVAEEKDTDGNLSASIQAFEYSDGIYNDIVQDYVPSPNTGLLDPNVISQPGTPTVSLNPLGTNQTRSFKVTSTVPSTGLVLYMDYNYGNTSNVQTHRLYRTVQQSNGDPFTNSVSSNIDINDLPEGQYYFSTTGRNNTSGRRSNVSNAFNWTGSIIPTPNVSNACNASSNGNVITSDPITNLQIGSNIYITSGTGTLEANTYVVSVANSTTFTITPTPNVALSNACIQAINGGINSNTIVPNPNLTAATYRLPNVTIANTGLITAISNGGITVQDEGNTIGNSVVTLNFTGNGVTVTGNSTFANINIPGSNGGGGGNFEYVYNEDVTLTSNTTTYRGALDGSLQNVYTSISSVAIYRIPGGKAYTANSPAVENYTWDSANDLYPALQNTASTTDGFLANSTGIFAPGGALTQASRWYTLSNNHAANSSYGWCHLMGVALPANFEIANENVVQANAVFQIVTDANTPIQYGLSFYRTINNSSTVITGPFVAWETVGTMDMIADQPQNFTVTGLFRQGDNTNANANVFITDIALCVRNPEPNCNAYVIRPSVFATQWN
jgi:hypothetical protein